MKILITGFTGFVGSNFIRKWSDKFTIYGLGTSKIENKGVEKVFLWNELDKLPYVDAIIHLAGKAHDTKNQSKSKIYFDVNTGLTQKIFDYFLTSEATKFLFFSSVKAVADKVEGILTEEVTPSPKGAYGKSKIQAEKYIFSKEKEYENTEKKVYIIRPCMMHGAENKGNLNLLYKIVSKTSAWPLAAYQNKRSFCSMDTASFIVENLLSKNIESGIYNIADDEPLATNDLIQLIGKSTGKKVLMIKTPKFIISCIAKFGDVLNLPLNTQRLDKLTENYIVSNQKIKKVLEIEEMPISATEGMLKTLNVFNRTEL